MALEEGFEPTDAICITGFQDRLLKALGHSSRYVWGEESFLFSHELYGVFLHRICIQPQQVSDLTIHDLQSIRIRFRHKPLVAIQMKFFDDLPLLNSWLFPVFQRRLLPQSFSYYMHAI